MTVGQLARRAGLSRSTLLYYDRIGLLRPSGRTPAGYRVYTEADAQRLQQVRLYRGTGLPLGAIRRLLAPGRSDHARLLQDQLARLGREIEELRARQRLIASILQKPRLLEESSPMNRVTWSRLLRAAGFDEEAMWRWHADFERTSPQDHQRFLEFLNVPADDIARIRERSRPT